MPSEDPVNEEQRLFLMFKQAIEDERRAQETYKEAMGITEDRLLVEVFRSLYEDEVRHERELVQRYEQFKAMLKA
jgi:rubrerythrin